MASDPPVTFVAQALRRRRRRSSPLYLLVALIAVLGVLALVLGIVALHRLGGDSTPYHADVVEHFNYGSMAASQRAACRTGSFRPSLRSFPKCSAIGAGRCSASSTSPTAS